MSIIMLATAVLHTVSAYIIKSPRHILLDPRAGTKVRSSLNSIHSNDGGHVEPFKLLDLPYGMGDLAPQISEETVRFHYLKHHAGYVKKLNDFAREDPSLAKKTLEEVVKSSQGAVYNMAAQIWNHDFYWLGMTPQSSIERAPNVKGIIDKTFGSIQEFKAKVVSMAAGHFGSGWVWLIYDKVTNTFKLVATKDADNPLRTLMAYPVLVVDVWEHAYYIDYRNDKAKYTEAWFEKINWERVEQLLATYKAS